MLVPELDVTALATSLRFYAEVLEFRILFERPSERFAYLEREGVELMLEEAAGPGRRFRTAPLELPCGRGVNFQLRVDDVDEEYGRLENVVSAFVQKPTTMPWGNRSLLFRDPDGNLVNFFTPVSAEAIRKFDAKA